jgi:WD40 repeat protein
MVFLQLWDARGALNGGIVTPGWEIQRYEDLDHHVAFSPNGSQLATGSSDSTVKLWSVSSGAPLKTLHTDLKWFNDVAFHPSGHQLALADDDILRIWTICEWSDRLHYLFFSAELKRIVFMLMCVKQKQENNVCRKSLSQKFVSKHR